MYQKQVSRKALYDALSSVAGGLASKDLVPILSSFCFHDGGITTFDDVVTMTTPFSGLEGFTGAVRGSTLLQWLNARKTDSVKLTVDGNESRWSAGKARLSLPVLPEEDFQYELLDFTDESIQSNESLTKAIAAATRSLGLDPAHEWRLGLTLEFDDEGLTIYASDNATCVRSWASIQYPHTLKGRALVLPPRFVELLKADKGSPIEWQFTDSQVSVRFPGDRWAHCRLLKGAKPRDHEGVFGNFDWDAGFSDVPPTLVEVLESTALVHSDKAIGLAVLSMEGNQLRVESKTSLGEVEEVLDITGSPQTCRVAVSPAMAIRSFKDTQVFKLSDSAVQIKSEYADILCGVEFVK